jgi:tetratricopeptide (TPR) repeat protein
MGDAYFHKSHDLKFEELEDTDPRIFELNDDMQKSIQYFEKALSRDDEDYTSVTHMMSIYGASDIPVTSAARYAAAVYEEVYWDANDVSGTLDLSNILMKSGKSAQACEYFSTAKKQAENDPNKEKFSLFNRVKLMEPKFSGKCDLS